MELRLSIINFPIVKSSTSYRIQNPFQGFDRYHFNGQEKDDEITGNTGDSYDFGARMYDARLGKWNSLDAHSSRYSALSPYSFVGNSPVHAIDPNGMDIVITGTPEYQLQVFNDLQKMTGEQLVLLSTGYVVRAVNAPDCPEDILATGNVTVTVDEEGNTVEKTMGTEMVGDLIDSPYKTEILLAEQGNATSSVSDPGNPYDKKDNSHAPFDSFDYNTFTPEQQHVLDMLHQGSKGTGAIIEYDPNDPGQVVCNADGSAGRPPEIGLGHELIHAWRMNQGKQDAGKAPIVYDYDTGKTGSPTMTKEELIVRVLEQTIRKEQGVGPRAQPVEVK
jgi:RHS repeat-associated protein